MAVVEAGQPRLWFARAANLLATAHAATVSIPRRSLACNVELGEGVTIGAWRGRSEEVRTHRRRHTASKPAR